MKRRGFLMTEALLTLGILALISAAAFPLITETAGIAAGLSRRIRVREDAAYAAEYVTEAVFFQKEIDEFGRADVSFCRIGRYSAFPCIRRRLTARHGGHGDAGGISGGTRRAERVFYDAAGRASFRFLSDDAYIGRKFFGGNVGASAVRFFENG